MAEEPTMNTSTSTHLSTSSSSSPHQPHEDASKHHTQVPPFFGFVSPTGDSQMMPVMYSPLVPGLLPLPQDQGELNHGPGIYAVSAHPYMGSAGFPSNTLIPFTYNVPTAPSSSESGVASEDQGQLGHQQPQQQQHLPPAPQRQVVIRRFQFAIHIDLLLMLKLAAVIFLFNHDGSRQRLALLIFFAAFVYLYQTGTLAPLIRWLSHGMHRAAAPPQPPRPAARAENIPAAGRQGNEDAVGADGEGRGENENEQVVEAGHNRLWGIVKEIQIIVFGFITSLLPGFHHID